MRDERERSLGAGGSGTAERRRSVLVEFVERCGQDLRLDALSAGGLVSEWGDDCELVQQSPSGVDVDAVSGLWRVTSTVGTSEVVLYGRTSPGGSADGLRVTVRESGSSGTDAEYGVDEIAGAVEVLRAEFPPDDVAATLSEWLDRAVVFHTAPAPVRRPDPAVAL